MKTVFDYINFSHSLLDVLVWLLGHLKAQIVSIFRTAALGLRVLLTVCVSKDLQRSDGNHRHLYFLKPPSFCLLTPLP